MRCDVDDLAASAPVIMFDNASGVVSGDDWSVRLTRRHAQIFERLWFSRGRVVSTAQLVEGIYSIDDEPANAEGSIHAHMSKLRGLLHPHGISIISERNKGYRLCSVVNIEALASVQSTDPVEYRSLFVTVNDRGVMAALMGKAEQHDCLPHHVALALLKAVVASDLIDAVFDGDPPQAFVHVPSGFPKEPAKIAARKSPPLGEVQRRVLDWFSAQPPGPVEVSVARIGKMLGCLNGQAHQVVKSLVQRGLIEIARQGKRGRSPSYYQLVRSDVA